METPSLNHPLLNHLVVRKVLGFAKLDFGNLKNFRLVCSLWYTVSLDKWRHSAILRLAENDDSKNGVTIHELCELFRESESYNDLVQFSQKPFSNFKFQNWVLTRPLDAEWLELWNSIVAPLVKSLQITSCSWPDGEHLGQVLFACENLQQLWIKKSRFSCMRMNHASQARHDISRLPKLKSIHVSGTMPMQWWPLLLHSPNLHSLTIQQDLRFERDTFALFLSDLHELEMMGRNPQNIKHLDIMEADDTFPDFVSLSNRNLQLESLSIQFEKTRDDHFLMPLLQTQARTLKILKICRISNRKDGAFQELQFPYGIHLPELTELHVWGHVINDLGFLRHLPKLKVLRISRNWYDKQHLFKTWRCRTEESIPQDIVASLGRNETLPEACGMESLYVDAKFSFNSLMRLKRCMPNLKSLEAAIGNEIMDVICTQWSSIRKIGCLYGSDLDDAGIRTIFKLKDLESFYLHTYCNRSKITNDAFKTEKAAFVLSKTLRDFQLCVSQQTSISMEQAILKANPRTRVKLIRNYGDFCATGNCFLCERQKYGIF